MADDLPLSVFRVEPDVKRSQYLVFDGNDDRFDEWTEAVGDAFNGAPLAERWVPPPVYSPEPLLQRPNVWFSFGMSGAFVIDQHAAEVLESELWPAELLPLPFEDELLYVVNITYVIDCLDAERSNISAGGYIEGFEFIPHRVPEAPVFKIPECLSVLSAEYEGGDARLRATVEANGLRGFVFDEVWNNRDGMRPLPQPY